MPGAPYEISKHAATVMAERGISFDWVQQTVESPACTEPDRDDPSLVHALRPIAENGGRTLRVVYNPTHRPWRIVTCFFDRRLKGPS